MTVIAWDGKTLAADMMATTGDVRLTSKKFEVIDGMAVAQSGLMEHAEALFEWVRNGRKADDYPKFQDSHDNGSCLIIATQEGCYFHYTQSTPIKLLDPFFAWGCGRDLALGAMAAGADAARAVEIANRFHVNCGGGVVQYKVR